MTEPSNPEPLHPLSAKELRKQMKKNRRAIRKLQREAEQLQQTGSIDDPQTESIDDDEEILDDDSSDEDMPIAQLDTSSEIIDNNLRDSNDQMNKLKIFDNTDDIVDFKNLLPEINRLNFNVIQISSKGLGHALSKFVTIGSLIHKLTPEDLTIVANLDGSYPHKETEKVHDNNGHKVPNTLLGLLANGTKFLDATIYLGMNPARRPKPVVSEFAELSDGALEIPTYDDMSKITTYIFIIFFYIIIRAHAPSENEAYRNQPVPKFITTILGCKASLIEICDYIASFELVKLSPEWVKYVPTEKVSQESMNRLGLGVAGYRIVSVFNIIIPDLYDDNKSANKKTSDLKNNTNEIADNNKLKEKPIYLDTAIFVMKSFKLAGYCWDFHPATRSPDVINKYGNINKNASNLLLEAYKLDTLKKLVELKKLSILPIFDPSHTDYRTWTTSMAYVATNRMFKK